MRVYRGPMSTDFSDDSHELVDSVNLAHENSPWFDRKVLAVNVTKDENLGQRRAVAHVQLDVADVVALHGSLLERLLRRAALADHLEKALCEIWDAVQWPSGTSDVVLKKVTKIADRARKKAKEVAR